MYRITEKLWAICFDKRLWNPFGKSRERIFSVNWQLGIPVISSWTTSDLIPSLHELSIAKNNFGLERIYHCVYKDKYNDRYTVLIKIPRGEWEVCLLRIICLKGAFLWSSPNFLSLITVMIVSKIKL